MPRTRLLARASLSGVAALAALAGCTSDPGTEAAPGSDRVTVAPVDQAPGNAADPEVDEVVPEAEVEAEMATDAPATDPGVVLTYAGYLADGGLVEAAAFVSGVVEDGGTCTVTATQGGTSVDASTEGTAGPRSTECGALAVALPEGASGAWQVRVAYESPGASGTSRTGTVTVP